MRTTIEWLDAAKALGVTRSTISGYRTGRSVFDEKTCIRVAEILGTDPLEVIASARVESAKDAETRGVWMHALEIFPKGFRLLRYPLTLVGLGSHRCNAS